MSDWLASAGLQIHKQDFNSELHDCFKSCWQAIGNSWLCWPYVGYCKIERKRIWFTKHGNETACVKWGADLARSERDSPKSAMRTACREVS